MYYSPISPILSHSGFFFIHYVPAPWVLFQKKQNKTLQALSYFIAFDYAIKSP